MNIPANSSVLAILAFHKIGAPSVGGWETWSYIPESTFVEYLRYLKEAAWEVIDLKQFLRGLTAPWSLPKKAALLTFDDGYRSNLTVAVPWLRRFGYPAIMFVPTDFVGGCNSFDTDVEPPEDICTWHELRELERAGVAIQSHGCSHQTFSSLSSHEQERELVRSKEILEGELRRPIEIFCYPYGDDGTNPNSVASALRHAGYQAAVLYGGGPHLVPVAHPYRLSRLATGPDTKLHEALSTQEYAVA
jgi:peptidoglycan/xylan/chitin deacetylase (PgdA/CDA1 family)